MSSFALMIITLIGYPLLAFLLSILLVRVTMAMLEKMALVDVPNARSNHATPVLRGGGMGVVDTILLLLATAPLVFGAKLDTYWTMLGAMLFLALVSFADDRKSLPFQWRLLAQLAAVMVGMLSLDAPLFGGLLPVWLDAPLTVLLWMWFINLTNFMDGIDGISGVEISSVTLGLALIVLLAPLPNSLFVYASVTGAAAAGFLVWNWHPARVFLGDVGSIPLGFITGFLLLKVATLGYPAVALILPAYYLGDATLTLAKRIARRERFWEAHSQHYYQRAVRKGWSHAHVAMVIGALNSLLVVLAALTALGMLDPWIGVAMAAGLVLVVLGVFRKKESKSLRV
ncbi:MAG: glycosyltransferase family 4 protein [Alphaproteobacteria bacterium]|nr:glycosyltransferase family 4 protein [Alphaproteobacteria bacterium]